MNNKLSETAAEVIRLAEAIRDFWDAELPKRHRDYPLVHPGEDSGPPPPEEQTLRNLLSGLPEDDLHRLMMIMYLGRGSFEPDDLPNQYEALRERLATRDWAVSQMMGKGSLADYLTDGLAELEKHGIDVNQLSITSMSSKS